MPRKGFTLVELLVTIAVIAILAALILPAIARAKGSATKTACVSNLRQLGLTLQIYTDDHGGQFPPRVAGSTWVEQTRADPGLLMCPAEKIVEGKKMTRRLSPSSYILNGFSDVLFEKAGHNDWQTFMATETANFPVTREDLAFPSETVIMGEKRYTTWKYYLDLLLDTQTFYTALEEGRHSRSGNTASTGLSNYLFGDGSVRSIKYGKSICPLNSWAVYTETRTSTALCVPH